MNAKKETIVIGYCPRLSGRGLVVPGRDTLTAIAAFSLPLVIYLLTMAPTIYNLDSAELTTAAATGGIVRATGYPLYLFIGRIWSWLPIGDVGYRLNLLSGVCGAVTLLMAEQILRRLGVSQWARLGAVGLLATAPFFWSLSLIAEVYTLHTALMATAILLLARWGEEPTLARFVGLVFLLALSLGNHLATVLLVPAFVAYALLRHGRLVLRPKWLLAAGGGLLAGLIIYLYLPFLYGGQPAFNYAGSFDANGVFRPVNLQSLAGLWWLVSGRSFAGQMLAYSWVELPGELAFFGQQLWIAFLGIGLGPGLLGAIGLLRRNWRFGLALGLIFLGNAIFYIDYRVVDKATMFLPTYLVWALWLGVGYQMLLDWLNSRPEPNFYQRVLVGLMVTVVAVALVNNWQLVDLSDDWSSRERGEAILSQVEPNALIFGWWDTVAVVQYLQLVEGQRPDVQVISRFLISGPDMTNLIEQEVASRPVYINNPPGNLLKTLVARPVGPIYQLSVQP